MGDAAPVDELQMRNDLLAAPSRLARSQRLDALVLGLLGPT